MSIFMRDVITDVETRRREQNEKWGDVTEQDRHMLMGTSDDLARRTMREAVQWITNQNMAAGTCTWTDIVREEFYEALAEDPSPANWPNLRDELIDVAASVVAMVEAGDLRASEEAQNQSTDDGLPEEVGVS